MNPLMTAIVNWTVLCLGLGFMIIGLVKLVRKLTFKKRSIQTKGIIVAIERAEYKDIATVEDDQYYPVIQYSTESGEKRTRRCLISSDGYTVGDRVWVYYDPANPDLFTLAVRNDLLNPALSILLGLGLAAMGIYRLVA